VYYGILILCREYLAKPPGPLYLPEEETKQDVKEEEMKSDAKEEEDEEDDFGFSSDEDEDDDMDDSERLLEDKDADRITRAQTYLFSLMQDPAMQGLQDEDAEDEDDEDLFYLGPLDGSPHIASDDVPPEEHEDDGKS
jgi:hypothetical protein